MDSGRLPERTHLGRVALRVADLERAAAFYERVLGLRRSAEGTTGYDSTPRNREVGTVHSQGTRASSGAALATCS
jgi:catechol 2,3-dioxygenase-like lactoylglutathione lyase family enzyme